MRHLSPTTVPAWATAVMSAVGTGAKVAGAKRKEGGAEGDRTFGFEQKCAIPSYLLALAVGELEARSVGPRSQVWSEPSMVAAAEHEFATRSAFAALVAVEPERKHVLAHRALLEGVVEGRRDAVDGDLRPAHA